MKYYIIAGEASGDLHASNLIKELKIVDTNANFRCWGGDLMQEQGANIIKHYKDLAFMGFAEVLLNIRTIFRNISFCKTDISNYQPDVLILVDYPGFNLRIAKWAKLRGIKVYYYISPQIWAWKKSRVHQIKKYVDKMFVILPFEKDFYAQFNYPVDFVGHPLLDAIKNKPKTDFTQFCNENKLTHQPIIALLPGSRKQEVSKVLPIMLSITDKFKNYQFVIAKAPSITNEFYNDIIKDSTVSIINNQTYNLLQQSTAALVTSGTATLETALLNIPQVVCYKGNPISFQIAKSVIRVKYISLVNLIVNKEIVKELIQKELNTTNLIEKLTEIITPNYRDTLLKNYEELRVKLGGGGASKKTAKLITQYLNN